MISRFTIKLPLIYAAEETTVADEKVESSSKAATTLFKESICQVSCYQYATFRASFRSEQNIRSRKSYFNQDRLMAIAGGMTLTSEDRHDYRKAVQAALHITHECLKKEKMAEQSGAALILAAVLPAINTHISEIHTLGDCYAFHVTLRINKNSTDNKIDIALERLNKVLHEASRASEQEHLRQYWAEKKLDGKLARDRHGAIRLCYCDKTSKEYIPTLNISRTIGDKNMHSSNRYEHFKNEFVNCPVGQGIDLVLLSSDGLFEGCHNPDNWLKNMLLIFCNQNNFNKKSSVEIIAILNSPEFLDQLNAFLSEKARKKDTKANASGDDLTIGILRANQFNFGGIVDGHGPEGDLVAHYCAVNIPRRIGKYFPGPKMNLRKTTQKSITETNTPEHYSPETPSQTNQLLDASHHEKFESYLPLKSAQLDKLSWIRVNERMQRAQTESTSSSSSSIAEIKPAAEQGKRVRSSTGYLLRESASKKPKPSSDRKIAFDLSPCGRGRRRR